MGILILTHLGGRTDHEFLFQSTIFSKKIVFLQRTQIQTIIFY